MFAKNWKAYAYVYKVRIQKSLAYRFDVYGNIIWQCIVMLSTAYFWRALYKGYDLVKGVRKEDMLVYTVISSVMSLLFQTNVESRVISSVRKGTIATDMLKPVRSICTGYIFSKIWVIPHRCYFRMCSRCY